MTEQDEIEAFIGSLARYDGFAPFSDAKLPIDPASRHVVVVAERDTVMAIAASALHTQSNGSEHRELEIATRPVMRFAAFEGAVLDAAMPLVDGSESFSIWSSRSSLDAALEERGFVENRSLDYLSVDLPLTIVTGMHADNRIRTFVRGDIEAVMMVNRSAFEGHREAAGLDIEEMERYLSESWFDADGFFVADDDGIAGFCWTKVHPDGDGEIFRIAVDPKQQGTGVGMALLQAGFSYLAARSDVHRGVLWVDTSNATAVNLYRSVGMRRERSNSEFAPG
jgi:mycothiol synthase